MSLEQFTFVAEIVAAVAVVISLIYVAQQVRQNTETGRISAAQAYVDTNNGVVSNVNLSPTLADILDRGSKDLSSLRGGERVQFSAFYDQSFICFQSFFLQWQRGVFDTRLWSTYGHVIADLMPYAGIREWWKSRRHWYDEAFRDYVDQLAPSQAV